MRIYYRSDTVTVNSDVVLVGDVVVPLGELSSPQVARYREGGRGGARMVLIGALGVQSAVVVAVTTQSTLVGAVAWALCTATGALLCGRLWRVRYEVWADYRGQKLLLFRSASAEDSRRLHRALGRAIEHSQRRPRGDVKPHRPLVVNRNSGAPVSAPALTAPQPEGEDRGGPAARVEDTKSPPARVDADPGRGGGLRIGATPPH